MRRRFICVVFLAISAGLMLGQAPNKAGVSSGPKPMRVQVSETVANGIVIHKVLPKYLAKARQAGMQGDVILKVVINTDGSVKDAQVDSGDSLLASAAVDAVKQWKFKPYFVNDQAVEVETLLSVRFSLTNLGNKELAETFAPAVQPTRNKIMIREDTEPSDSTEPPPPPMPMRVRVSQGVMMRLLVHKVDPEYPTDARAAGVDGTVELRVIVGKDGTVLQADGLSGDERLAPAAIAAVRQWTFKPYLLNGSPVEVESTVTVEFK